MLQHTVNFTFASFLTSGSGFDWVLKKSFVNFKMVHNCSFTLTLTDFSNSVNWVLQHASSNNVCEVTFSGIKWKFLGICRIRW